MIRDEKDDPDLGVFDPAMSKMEKLHEQVQRPMEQLADGEALLDLASVLVSATKSENREGPTPSQFVASLLRKFGVGPSPLVDSDELFSWSNLATVASPLFMAATGCQTMQGPTDLAIKERRRRAVRRQSWRFDTSKPAVIDELAAEPDERNETDENMAVMFGLLRRNKCVKLENIILNRQSFAQTVENIFSLSFLVKDGRVAVNVDDKGDHYVIPKNAPAAGLIASGKVLSSQFVFRFDSKDWTIMKGIVEPGNELMPHRNCNHGDQQKDARSSPAGDGSRLGSDSIPRKQNKAFAKGEVMEDDLTNGRCGHDVPKRRKRSHAARKLFSDED
ncbi:hypothetical protein EJB05_48366 [Eragrostis curvula]|uniref:Non-structural maintenance of chromosomes element 4 n=1 Tax=Eragrostis curvula TaxID=38414 RepID=A0A5J9T1P2_9POAL|nr:hypothetical protein EJB05_48366 [Eragrostis curvula]